MRAYAAINRLRHRFLTYGRVAAWSPSIQGPGGTVLRDYSGRGNDGTLTNMDPASDWVVSGGKRALDFDGTNDYSEFGDKSPWKFGKNDSFVVAGWVRVPNGTTQGTLYTNVVTRDNWPANGGYGLKFANSNTKISAFSGLFTGGTKREVQYATAVNDGKWRHVALVHTPGALALFVDGIQIGSDTAVESEFNHAATLKLGSRIGTDNHFTGQLDDIAIYNRALPHAEIKLLALRRGIAYEQTEFEPYVTQWGSVAAAAAFQAAWGSNATTIAGVASGR